MKSHLWLQEPGEFPPAEATLYEKKLEMSFCCKMKTHIRHPLGCGAKRWGLGQGCWEGPASQDELRGGLSPALKTKC